MKDALGREIAPGDALAYASRRGSGHSVYVAVVKEVVDVPAGEWTEARQFVRADVVAGTGFRSTLGRWDDATRSWVPCPTRRVALRYTGNMILLPGLDVAALREASALLQRANHEAMVERRARTQAG